MTEWGFFKGAWLTVKRLARCGPWHEGGFDPPPRKSGLEVENNTRIESEPYIF